MISIIRIDCFLVYLFFRCKYSINNYNLIVRAPPHHGREDLRKIFSEEKWQQQQKKKEN